jgi:hypothetical protein
VSNESRAGSDLIMNGKTFLFQQLSEEDSRRLDSLYNVATRSQDDAQSTRSMGSQHGSEASATRSNEERHVGIEELATRSLVDLQYDVVPSTRSHGEQILS